MGTDVKVTGVFVQGPPVIPVQLSPIIGKVVNFRDCAILCGEVAFLKVGLGFSIEFFHTLRRGQVGRFGGARRRGWTRGVGGREGNGCSSRRSVGRRRSGSGRRRTKTAGR